jgi:hypothetical protein
MEAFGGPALDIVHSHARFALLIGVALSGEGNLAGVGWHCVWEGRDYEAGVIEGDPT